MSMEENTDASVKSNEGQEEKPNSESSLPEPTTGSMQELPGKFSAAGVANWAKNLRISSNPNVNTPEKNSVSSEGLKNPFSLFGGSFGRKTDSLKIPVVEVPIDSESSSSNEGTFGNLAKGILDTSKSAMRAVQTKARHLVSQNKRRYQEDGFDLDLAYITDNIIAMGFPAGDMSSGILGFVEGFYRNHMEEVIKFLETHHKEKYKVYNLCSERLYDASLFEGKVACFPFDDHNSPPLQLVTAFCQSAYSWLKADLENVVVVHCKAGKARTGLMITALLLFLKFFPTAEESIAFYNQKRCVDGKGLILPSQIRYVKYFERVLRNCDGVTPFGRKVVLRGFRLHKCPYWIRPSITILNHDRTVFSSKKHPRTKDMMPEDIWFNAPRKGIMVFALPGERGLADLDGDFKVLFHDRHGDFYCWLNTNMMENRTMLTPADLDGFDKRRLPSPGFQVEIVILDYDVSISSKVTENAPGNPLPSTIKENPPTTSGTEGGNKKGNQEKDDVFSDTESEGSVRKPKVSPNEVPDLQMIKEVKATPSISNQKVRDPQSNGKDNNLSSSKEVPQQVNNGSSIESSSTEPSKLVDHGSKVDALQLPASDFKAIAAASAADASVFTFGDEEDFDSEDDS